MDNDKICVHCGTMLTFDKTQPFKKFCSHSCAAKHNNHLRKKKRGCERCGEELLRYQNKFCSNECQVTYQRPEFEELKTDSTRKKRLIEELGWQCQECGTIEWLGKPVPIELEHSDGNCSNNDRNNLRLLCCNCHALTDTYKGKNMGNGRKHRRDRYHLDKNS